MTNMQILEDIKSQALLNDTPDGIAKLMWTTSTDVAIAYVKEGYRNRKKLREFGELMATNIVSSAVLTVSEESTKGNSDYIFPIEYVAFLKEMVDIITQEKDSYRHMDEKLYDVVIGNYRKALLNILTPRIKELSKIKHLNDIVIVESLLVIPNPSIIYDDTVVGPYTGKLIRLLTRLSAMKDQRGKRIYDPEASEVVDLLQALFGKRLLPSVASSIFINANSAKVLDENGNCMLTLAAAEILNNASKKDLKREIRRVIEFKFSRGIGRDKKIRLDQVVLMDYPNLEKRVRKEIERIYREEPKGKLQGERKQRNNNNRRNNNNNDQRNNSNNGWRNNNDQRNNNHNQGQRNNQPTMFDRIGLDSFI